LSVSTRPPPLAAGRWCFGGGLSRSQRASDVGGGAGPIHRWPRGNYERAAQRRIGSWRGMACRRGRWLSLGCIEPRPTITTEASCRRIVYSTGGTRHAIRRGTSRWAPPGRTRTSGRGCRRLGTRFAQNRTTVEAIPDVAWIAASAPSTLHASR
jgi:hypothetical protein